MSVDTVTTKAYTDLQGLNDLKVAARANDPAAMRATARQFETLFAKMMLQSMREASMGDDLFDTQEGQMYRGMFDDQIALEMTQGKGLGIADMLVQQLTRNDVAAQAATPGVDRTISLSAPVPATEPAAPAVVSTPPITALLPSQTPPAPGSRRAFLESLLPAAREAAATLGVTPKAILAQAALESGWGRAMPANPDGRSSFNLFGIKATDSWKGASVPSLTSEFVNGREQRMVERFRAYDSVEHSVADHARLLARSARYAEAMNSGDDVAAYANALQRGGYATDPRYASKLIAVAESVEQILAGNETVRTEPARTETTRT